MSLIHEALKKAEREQPVPSSHVSSRFNVIRTRSRRPLGLALAAGALLGLIGLVWAAVYFERPAGIVSPPSEDAQAQARPPAAVSASAPNAPTAALPVPRPPVEATEANGLLASAAAAHAKGDYPAAEALLTRALEMAPASPLAHNNLGLAIKAQGRLDEAEKHYLAALQNDPQYVRAVNNLAVLYDEQNRIDEAFRLYASAVRIDPRYADARLNYAVALERSGFLADARKQYEAFLAHAAGAPPRAIELVRRRLAALP